MCGIAGALSINGTAVNNLSNKLRAMSALIEHRGPDGAGQWQATDGNVGLVHRRLAIIDLTDDGHQPMLADNGTVITYNGEIYNFIEMREQFASKWNFQSKSDTEVILAAYNTLGPACVEKLRGMFSYALWDHKTQTLECARDRFGIKPFYYTIVKGVLYFASEIKALLPVLEEVQIDRNALAEYLTFQYPITDRTLFHGVFQLLPGEQLTVRNGNVNIRKYWDLRYEHDRSITMEQAQKRIGELVDDSISVHLRSDVPVGSYLSGGVDSSLVATMAVERSSENNLAFHGKFTSHSGYDESHYAEIVARQAGLNLKQIDITSTDFENHISDVVYHLDHPVAGPGAFPQYMVSKLAREHVKVVLGGQGGDEIFGGYARYLVGYFDQVISGAFDGKLEDGAFPITLEALTPNLHQLQEYKPLMQQLCAKGMFGTIDKRFLRLIDRSTDLAEEVDWGQLDIEHVHAAYSDVYNDRAVISEDATLDSMARFDFKRLLPALLQVEDRMSMAHGLESRVPLIDHPLVEYVATLPPEIKYKDGRLKDLLRTTFRSKLPQTLFDRRDKMGFPVPLKEWYGGDLNTFVRDTFHSRAAKERGFMRADKVLANFGSDGRFSRKTWGLLSLELWNQRFVDQAHVFRKMTD